VKLNKYSIFLLFFSIYFGNKSQRFGNIPLLIIAKFNDCFHFINVIITKITRIIFAFNFCSLYLPENDTNNANMILETTKQTFGTGITLEIRPCIFIQNLILWSNNEI
jgi:hypothetical protein